MGRRRHRPAVGARFRGHVKRNGKGPVYWTTCTVSECEPGKTFAFGVGAAGKTPLNVWRYDIAPAGDGCDVTESFTLSPTFGLRLYWARLGLVPRQDEPQRHADDARADPGRGREAGCVGVEDRSSPLLYLELGEPRPTAAQRGPRPGKERGRRTGDLVGECAFERTDLPMRIRDGRTLVVAEAGAGFAQPPPTSLPPEVFHAHCFRRHPRPSQGVLTGQARRSASSIVWIGPRTPDLAAACATGATTCTSATSPPPASPASPRSRSTRTRPGRTPVHALLRVRQRQRPRPRSPP